jgi:hypothetical protein
MDNFLIPAALVLIGTNIVFAYLAHHWRVMAKLNKADVLRVALGAVQQHRDGYAEGYQDGERTMRGRLYQHALKADRSGGDVLAALRDAGKMPGETGPIVQVLEEV